MAWARWTPYTGLFSFRGHWGSIGMLRVRLLVLVGLLLAGITAHGAEPVQMMTNFWPPYVDKTLPEEGLAVELAKHIFKRAGYQAHNTVEQLPKDSELAHFGSYDVVAALWPGEEPRKDYIYSKPYLVNEMIVVTPTQNARRYFSIGNLKGGRIGLLKDHSYGVDFSEIAGVRLIYATSMTQNLVDMFDDKLHYVVGDRHVIAQQLGENFPIGEQQVRVLAISLPPRPLHVAALRDNPQGAALIKAFNSALVEVKRDSSYQQIVKKWRQRYQLQTP